MKEYINHIKPKFKIHNKHPIFADDEDNIIDNNTFDLQDYIINPSRYNHRIFNKYALSIKQKKLLKFSEIEKLIKDKKYNINIFEEQMIIFNKDRYLYNPDKNKFLLNNKKNREDMVGNTEENTQELKYGKIVRFNCKEPYNIVEIGKLYDYFKKRIFRVFDIMMNEYKTMKYQINIKYTIVFDDVTRPVFVDILSSLQ